MMPLSRTLRSRLAAAVGLLALLGARPEATAPTAVEREDEPRLRNVRQLTFGGENAEAYWSVDGRELILQATREGLACDQIFRMNADGSEARMVSTGKGRTTCSFIQLDGSILYSSTHGHDAGCLWSPDRSEGYVWPVYPEMDIWRAGPDGENRIVFTSNKDGDLELYVMDRDGRSVTRLTHTPGYDGGAFFSPDCSKIVWRASRPTGDELESYRALLAKNLVKPSKLEIFVADADGSNVVQVTNNGAANFGPYLHADNERILCVSNQHDPRGRNFDIFLIKVDGTGQ
jgi:Tol biopolymer transport system component